MVTEGRLIIWDMIITTYIKTQWRCQVLLISEDPTALMVSTLLTYLDSIKLGSAYNINKFNSSGSLNSSTLSNNLHSTSRNYNQLYTNNPVDQSNNYPNPLGYSNNMLYSANNLLHSNNNLSVVNNSMMFSRGQGMNVYLYLENFRQSNSRYDDPYSINRPGAVNYN
jgi:hypothetical protein